MKKEVALIIIMLLLPALVSANEDSCSGCHADAQKMEAAGFPQFAFSSSEVKSQTHMPASCTDCHLGDPTAATAEQAHRNMLTLMVVRQKTWVVSTRAQEREDLKDWPSLEPRGNDRSTRLSPKRSYDGNLKNNSDFRTFLYHDKNPVTLAFNPVIAQKTCGKCHAEIVQTFLKSSMGGGTGAHVQNQYRTWTGATGPQSCGLWMGVLTKPAQDAFTDENIVNFNRHSTMLLSNKDGQNSQRKCNQCHVGCLDCHLDPRAGSAERPGDGPHTFVKKPEPLACYGGGRSFSCHAGPLERRRGDGYIRAEFTQASPQGKAELRNKPDIHMQKNMSCVDCHEPNRQTGYHGDLRRDVDCGKCHGGIATALRKGPHRKVDCAACHTSEIGGYAFNFWSAVGPQGKEDPLTRIQDYLTGATTPLLIRNPKGVWIPVHLVPHTSGNVRAAEVKISKRLLFRNKPDSAVERRYTSNDSYAVTALIRDLDGKDHDVMVWINLDRVAHATGRARTCESCHATAEQRITVIFSGGSYKDVENGQYTIVADARGLRVTDIKDENGSLPKDLVRLQDAWSIKGNFSLPLLKDRAAYEKLKKDRDEGRFTH
jgi:hypothetical protein